ncbi:MULTISPECIES: phage baseplate assembly protein V [Pseudomonas]|uniref:phage baseplate assembly protein V n=1 Tax=Pseudomonas TaxID=286 RepID=UPI0005A9A5E5|nr:MULTISPECIES: phage baseplate assembly protein V [Pseudomonas]AZD92058.1 Phage baseplate protein [Pseudomonas chlororaphis subsp. aureofaciens]KAB0531319.1 phage baseplate assembly protein V [Pseudomonas chlororaphis subsp. aureofaciens]TSD32357.1 phage baseplate assembly protein V [Pseudomonas sp. ATCC 13985]WDG62931.1 phage baseplate assembly protein V [Pseudomonas chlororaphis]WDG69198.1 phage baseplate assembly protein V [Pseudomonas chlororaphis]
MGVQLEYGEVSAVDYMTCRIRVRLDDRDGVESYWLNVLQRNTQGTQRRPLMPELNEQVAVLLDSDGVGGVYLGGVYSTAEPPPVVDQDTDYVRFSDGTVSTYDRVAGVMTLDCVGALLVKCGRNITVEAGEPVVVKAPSATLDIPQVTLNGNLQVNGDVGVNGNVNATGAVLDIGGNSNHHSH